MRGRKFEISAFVDRIEGDIAVVLLGEEQDTRLDLPLKYLPAKVSEGHWLRIAIEIDHKKTDAVRKRVRQLMDELTEKSANRD
jgi:hypothetical protein